MVSSIKPLSIQAQLQMWWSTWFQRKQACLVSGCLSESILVIIQSMFSRNESQAPWLVSTCFIQKYHLLSNYGYFSMKLNLFIKGIVHPKRFDVLWHLWKYTLCSKEETKLYRYGTTFSESDVTYGQIWWPILGICALHLNHPKCTHTAVNTHPEQWAAIYAAAPGEQLGVRCLAQGHLSHGIEGGESAVHSPPPTYNPCRPSNPCRQYSNSQPLD